MSETIKHLALSFFIFMVLSFFIFIFASALECALVAPLHEFGHFVAAFYLNVKVLKIETSRIYVDLPTGDWRWSIIGYTGGLFASLVLAVLYMFTKDGLKWLSNRTKHSQRRKGVVDDLSLVVLNAMVADVMIAFATGLIEGSNQGSYLMLASDPVLSKIVVLGMLFAFSSIALLLWNRKWLIWKRESSTWLKDRKASLNCTESAPFPKDTARKKVAKFVGVSHDTLAKAEGIVGCC